jgi:hypothetical protein
MNFDHHLFSNLRFVCLSFGAMLLLGGCANDAGRVQRISNGFAPVDGSTAQPPTPESDTGLPSAGLNRFPQLGELRISEILFDPNNGLEDIHGEWVEIENVAQEPLTLDDCRLTDSAHLENRNAQADLSGIVLDPAALTLIKSLPIQSARFDPVIRFNFRFTSMNSQASQSGSCLKKVNGRP